MADRYCRNCGHELAENDRFCPNCGTPVHEAAHVPTPKADVPVPPPPQQAWDATSLPRQQPEAPTSGRTGTAGRLFVGCLVVAFALFALFVGTAIVGGGGGNSPADQAAQPGQEKRQQQPSGDEEEAKQAGGGGGMETAIVKKWVALRACASAAT